MKRLILFLLSVYKNLVSPLLKYFLGQGCRFAPTCGEYARESVRKFGVIRGGGLALKRLSRCHPLSNYPTLDPVPEVRSQSSSVKSQSYN